MFIFGAGKFGAFWLETLRHKYNIAGFIDNDKTKKEYKGLPVYSDELKSEDSIILLAFYHKSTADEVINQLTKEYNFKLNENMFWLTPFLKDIDDEEFLKLFYTVCFEKELRLNPPITYNEKLQWLKLYDRNPKYTILADKHKVRAKVDSKYLIPLLGTYENAHDIDFEALPEQFVLKCNHDSDSVVICKSIYVNKYGKVLPNEDAVKTKLNAAISQNWYYLAREWAYKNIKPLIMAEEYIGDDIQEYRFYVFNGKVKLIHVDFDTATFRKANMYTPDWDYIPCSWTYPTDPNKKIKKPDLFNKMVEIAETLSKGLLHLRVDLFLAGNKIYFGETGFYHSGGFAQIKPYEYDELFGSWLDLTKE